MHVLLRLWILVPVIGAANAAAAELRPAFEGTAETLRKTVVTVRLLSGKEKKEKQAAAESRSAPAAAGPRVTVCSGVSVGSGLVVCPLYAGSDSRIRITRSGGDQATARVRVIDEYSGLALLKTDKADLPAIELAGELPKAGAWVMSGSGWGADPPVLSLGIVSGTGIALPKAAYPPLIRCDLRTADTSSGAPVVDQSGKLIGVIVLVERNRPSAGWTYAVPVRHVERLIRTWKQVEANKETTDRTVIFLKRRRPVVGMVLEGSGDDVTVGRVYAASPAARAGIQKGDQILAVDRVKIRSVYQALRPVLNKQPGDTVTFLVRRAAQVDTVDVVLGGGVQLPSAPFANLSRWIRPKIDLEGVTEGLYRSRAATGPVREVFAPGSPGIPDAAAGDDSVEKIRLLEKSLDRYRNVILYLQQQLKESERKRLQCEAAIRSLEEDLQRLKRKLQSETPARK